jgi:hypothetical protein
VTEKSSDSDAYSNPFKRSSKNVLDTLTYLENSKDRKSNSYRKGNEVLTITEPNIHNSNEEESTFHRISSG